MNPFFMFYIHDSQKRGNTKFHLQRYSTRLADCTYIVRSIHINTILVVYINYISFQMVLWQKRTLAPHECTMNFGQVSTQWRN